MLIGVISGLVAQRISSSAAHAAERVAYEVGVFGLVLDGVLVDTTCAFSNY